MLEGIQRLLQAARRRRLASFVKRRHFQVSLDENTPETPLRMYSRKVAGLELFSITVQYKDDSADLLSHYTVSLTSSLVWRQVGGRLSLHYRTPYTLYYLHAHQQGAGYWRLKRLIKPLLSMIRNNLPKEMHDVIPLVYLICNLSSLPN
ncbi:hypothetical protein CIB48_g9513 [Xylaria polymorpha]|nr:hypothetical protein CIB48_g9513 [Xylaria polymorpha]